MKALGKLLAVLSLSLTLTACDWFIKPDPVTEYVYIPINVPTAPRPDKLNLSDVKFTVVNQDRLQSYLTENRKRNGEVIFIALDVREYEALSTNTAEMTRYIEQSLDVFKYYEQAIHETQESANTANEAVPVE